MLGTSGHEYIVALNQAKIEALRLQAEIDHQLPKSLLRHRIAMWLRRVAESLEPSRPTFLAKQQPQA